ncbi:MAG: DsrE family protein [Gammaproteobacteria bacterium]|nr:DsrE family protein [Gammaproteobacteria bacterium]
MKNIMIACVLGASVLTMGLTAHATELNNQAALAGIQEIKVVYDVRKANPQLLLAYLKGIESNRNNLALEGVKATQRVVFIADAVKYITSKPANDISIEHGELLTQIADQIKRLKSLGIEMEVCSAATAAYKIDNSTILPGIKVVRSGFLSVMGWQAQGYQLVPVYN